MGRPKSLKLTCHTYYRYNDTTPPQKKTKKTNTQKTKTNKQTRYVSKTPLLPSLRNICKKDKWKLQVIDTSAKILKRNFN